MIFHMTAIGGGEFRQPIPVADWQSFTMIGMMHRKGKFYITHATMADIEEFMACRGKEIIDVNSKGEFTINGNAWSESLDVDSDVWNVAWICWYKGHPDNPFFIPRGFPSDPNYFTFDYYDQGVWDYHDTIVTFRGRCVVETPFLDIIERYSL